MYELLIASRARHVRLYLLYDTESLYAVVLWLIIVRFSAQIDNEHGGIISFFQTKNIYY